VEFKFSPEDEAFRQELHAFIRQELPPGWEGGGRWPEEQDWDLTRRLRRKMASKGWLTMHWPKEYGGMGASQMQQMIYAEEAAYRALPTDVGTGAVSWVAPGCCHPRRWS
jgi:hypothetical protein